MLVLARPLAYTCILYQTGSVFESTKIQVKPIEAKFNQMKAVLTSDENKPLQTLIALFSKSIQSYEIHLTSNQRQFLIQPNIEVILDYPGEGSFTIFLVFLASNILGIPW